MTTDRRREIQRALTEALIEQVDNGPGRLYLDMTDPAAIIIDGIIDLEAIAAHLDNHRTPRGNPPIDPEGLDAYEPDDPKAPGYADRLAERADIARDAVDE